MKIINPGDYKKLGNLEYREALRLHAGMMLEEFGFGRWYANEYKTNCVTVEKFEELIEEVEKACPEVGYYTIINDLCDFVFVV